MAVPMPPLVTKTNALIAKVTARLCALFVVDGDGDMFYTWVGGALLLVQIVAKRVRSLAFLAEEVAIGRLGAGVF